MKNLFGNIADQAIERLREFEHAAIGKDPAGYYVAYSGGKDSDVILDLVRRSGVKYTAHHHLTTCDPPELVRHVKRQTDVEIVRPKESIWQLIRRKGFLPTGHKRYCCELLKERGGINRFVVLGVRWEESKKRSNRRMLETCFKSKRKQYLNVIIEWNKKEVWDHINRNCAGYCSLYDEGFNRLGCAVCPMATKEQTAIEIRRFPKIARAWYNAGKAVFNPKKSAFKTYDEMWGWWISREWGKRKQNEGPMMFFED